VSYLRINQPIFAFNGFAGQTEDLLSVKELQEIKIIHIAFEHFLT